MKLLNNLYTINEGGEDLSRLPKDVVTSIRSNIRKGAEDLSQKWANALELVHKAYQVEGVERPSPDMEAAWKQYEENLAYAVQQLADNRGMDGDWRMSSSIFHEAKIPLIKYRVNMGDTSKIVEAKNLDDLIETVKQGSIEYDVLVERNSNSDVTLKFSKWGIRKNQSVTVTRIS